MAHDEERLALFLDYENLAIGAREDHKGFSFDLKPVADVLAERGRVVVRRAYADWSYFEADRRMLTEHHVELIEITQRLKHQRKNAADIKLAVDAIELSFERDYITTFVIATGDSDFTPLVDKLRALNKRVVGVGMESSTSGLLPPACDEFMFYERLEGVDLKPSRGRGRGRRGRGGRGGGQAPPAAEAPAAAAAAPAEPAAPAATSPAEEVVPEPPVEPAAPAPAEAAAGDLGAEEEDDAGEGNGGDPEDLVKLVTQTLSGLQRSSGGAVVASALKRAMLRKDPTFNEADHGFRAFGELLRHLEHRGIVELSEGTARGDPEVAFPEAHRGEEEAFALLRDTIADLAGQGSPPPLSGLKDQLRKRDPGFSEKSYGYGGFLQFCKAARARGLVTMEWDEDADDYVLEPVHEGASS